MRILVISNSPWDDANSFGSTFSNFFNGVNAADIASIYCSGGEPSTEACGRFFRISESDLAHSIKGRRSFAGKRVENRAAEASVDNHRGGLMSFAKKHRWTVFFWARELLWKLGKWKSPSLDDFINEFSPDLLVLPTYSFSYINKLALYIKKKWNLPMVSYVSDDEYTLRQFSLSPLYWINRLYQRKWVKRGIINSEALYTISELQRKEYEKIFKVPTRVLTKCLDFSADPEPLRECDDPLKLVYTGNVGGGRWKSLAIIAKALERINADRQRASLDIYTATPMTKGMRKALNVGTSSAVLGSVSSCAVKRLQAEADVLVHVEALDLKNTLAVRQSFSTKLVDYFKAAKPILAVGRARIASIQHLSDNGCAVVITKAKDADGAVRELSDFSKRRLVAQNAYECGRKHHDITNQRAFLTDLEKIVRNFGK